MANRAARVSLFILTGVALYFCYLLVAPFLKPIVFSMVLAIVFYPVHRYIHHWIRNRNFSAALSTSVVILFITLGSVLLGRAIVSGLQDVYQSLSSSGAGKERLSLFIVHAFDRGLEWVSRYIPFSVPDLQAALLSQAEKAVATLLTMSLTALGGMTSIALNGLIAFFILFFLLRDGRSVLRRGRVLLPLRPDQVTRLYACVKDTLNAIVYGSLAMAGLQGALTAIAFWFLALASPALWGVVTALCALLPVIGTTLVLLPAICMLIFAGHWLKGTILLAWAVAVVHPVDNVLRPYLIGERVKLSTLYVFLALLGGLKTFGGLGLFIGPLILALTVALFRFLREERLFQT